MRLFALSSDDRLSLSPVLSSSAYLLITSFSSPSHLRRYVFGARLSIGATVHVHLSLIEIFRTELSDSSQFEIHRVYMLFFHGMYRIGAHTVNLISSSKSRSSKSDAIIKRIPVKISVACCRRFAFETSRFR